MVDEKLEKVAEEEDQHDLYDPKLKDGELWYGMTKAEVAQKIAQQAAWAEQHQDDEEFQAQLIAEAKEEERMRLKELLILQVEDGAVFYRDWENAPRASSEAYFNTDFPNFVKTIRSDVLELTLEGMGYSIGVTKNQMARIEAGGSRMTPSNMLLMFDQVEKALIRQGKEWYSLGEHEVDNLIPDMYKRLRGWVYGRTAEWHYSENGLVVENAIPPLLAQYPEQSIPALDPDKFDRVFANRTKGDRDLIKKGELEITTFKQRQYIEDAKTTVANSPKKKPKEVAISWAILERNIKANSGDSASSDEIAQYKNDLSKLEFKYGRLGKTYDGAVRELNLVKEDLDRTKLRMETAEKLVAVYEHQIRHNKEMADAGNTKAILGLPKPPPEKWTIDDVPEDLQEEIFEKMHEEHLQDMAADAQAEDRHIEEMKNSSRNK